MNGSQEDLHSVSSLEKLVQLSMQSFNHIEKQSATRLLDQLRTRPERWQTGLRLFFESSSEICQFFGLSLARDYLASSRIHEPPVTPQESGFTSDSEVAAHASIREALTRWIVAKLEHSLSLSLSRVENSSSAATRGSSSSSDGGRGSTSPVAAFTLTSEKIVPAFIFNNIISVFALLIKLDFPQLWPTAFADILGVLGNSKYGVCGLDIIVRLLKEIELEIVVFHEGRTAAEIKHNVLIKDTMRSTNIIQEILQYLCFWATHDLPKHDEFSGNMSGNSEGEDGGNGHAIREEARERCVLCIADLTGWIDINLVVSIALPVIYTLLQSTAPPFAPALTCLYELVKKGMDPVLKIQLIQSVNLVPVLSAIPFSLYYRHSATRIPSQIRNNAGILGGISFGNVAGVDVRSLQQLGSVLDMVVVELLGCWSKFEEFSIQNAASTPNLTPTHAQPDGGFNLSSPQLKQGQQLNFDQSSIGGIDRSSTAAEGSLQHVSILTAEEHQLITSVPSVLSLLRTLLPILQQQLFQNELLKPLANDLISVAPSQSHHPATHSTHSAVVTKTNNNNNYRNDGTNKLQEDAIVEKRAKSVQIARTVLPAMGKLSNLLKQQHRYAEKIERLRKSYTIMRQNLQQNQQFFANNPQELAQQTMLMEIYSYDLDTVRPGAENGAHGPNAGMKGTEKAGFGSGGAYFYASEYLDGLLVGCFHQLQLAYTGTNVSERYEREERAGNNMLDTAGDDDEEEEDENEFQIIEMRRDVRKLFVNCCRVSPARALEMLGALLSSLPQPWSSCSYPELEAALQLVHAFSECGPSGARLVAEGSFPAMLTAIHQTDVVAHPHPAVVLTYFEVSLRYVKRVSVACVLHVLGTLTNVPGIGLRSRYAPVRNRCAYTLLKMSEAVEGLSGAGDAQVARQGGVHTLVLDSIGSSLAEMISQSAHFSPGGTKKLGSAFLSDAAELHMFEALAILISSGCAASAYFHAKLSSDLHALSSTSSSTSSFSSSDAAAATAANANGRSSEQQGGEKGVEEEAVSIHAAMAELRRKHGQQVQLFGDLSQFIIQRISAELQAAGAISQAQTLAQAHGGGSQQREAAPESLYSTQISRLSHRINCLLALTKGFHTLPYALHTLARTPNTQQQQQQHHQQQKQQQQQQQEEVVHPYSDLFPVFSTSADVAAQVLQNVPHNPTIRIRVIMYIHRLIGLCAKNKATLHPFSTNLDELLRQHQQRPPSGCMTARKVVETAQKVLPILLKFSENSDIEESVNLLNQIMAECSTTIQIGSGGAASISVATFSSSHPSASLSTQQTEAALSTAVDLLETYVHQPDSTSSSGGSTVGDGVLSLASGVYLDLLNKLMQLQTALEAMYAPTLTQHAAIAAAGGIAGFVSEISSDMDRNSSLFPSILPSSTAHNVTNPLPDRHHQQQQQQQMHGGTANGGSRPPFRPPMLSIGLEPIDTTFNPHSGSNSSNNSSSHIRNSNHSLSQGLGGGAGRGGGGAGGGQHRRVDSFDSSYLPEGSMHGGEDETAASSIYGERSRSRVRAGGWGGDNTATATSATSGNESMRSMNSISSMEKSPKSSPFPLHSQSSITGNLDVYSITAEPPSSLSYGTHSRTHSRTNSGTANIAQSSAFPGISTEFSGLSALSGLPLASTQEPAHVEGDRALLQKLFLSFLEHILHCESRVSGLHRVLFTPKHSHLPYVSQALFYTILGARQQQQQAQVQARDSAAATSQAAKVCVFENVLQALRGGRGNMSMVRRISLRKHAVGIVCGMVKRWMPVIGMDFSASGSENGEVQNAQQHFLVNDSYTQSLLPLQLYGAIHCAAASLFAPTGADRGAASESADRIELNLDNSTTLASHFQQFFFEHVLPTLLGACSDGSSLDVRDAAAQGLLAEIATLLWQTYTNLCANRDIALHGVLSMPSQQQHLLTIHILSQHSKQHQHQLHYAQSLPNLPPALAYLPQIADLSTQDLNRLAHLQASEVLSAAVSQQGLICFPDQFLNYIQGLLSSKLGWPDVIVQTFLTQLTACDSPVSAPASCALQNPSSAGSSSGTPLGTYKEQFKKLMRQAVTAAVSALK